MHLLALPLLFAAFFGNKTLTMFEELDKGGICEYESTHKTFIYKNKKYQILTGAVENFSSMPVVSIGSFPLGREIILYDPGSSPLLEGHYLAFTSMLREEYNTEDVILLLASYIKNILFAPHLCNDSSLNTFLHQWMDSNEREFTDFVLADDSIYLPVIPIEDFIENQVGICRHLSFASTYFLSRLTSENYLEGNAYLVRDSIKTNHGSGGHAWTLFVDSEKKCWHIDVLWDVIKNMSDPEDFNTLCGLYGQEAMHRQIQRYQY